MSSIQLYPFMFRGVTKYGHFVTRLLTLLCIIAYLSIFISETKKIGTFYSMQKSLFNYETNFNLSSMYSDITPFKVGTQGGVEDKNLPFYIIENATETTCEEWKKMNTSS